MSSIQDLQDHFASDREVVPSFYKNSYLRKIATEVSSKRVKDKNYVPTVDECFTLILNAYLNDDVRKRFEKKYPQRTIEDNQVKQQIIQEGLRALYPDVKKLPPKEKAFWVESTEDVLKVHADLMDKLVD